MCKDNTIRIVDARTYTEIGKKKLDKRVNQFCWTNDNKHILTTSKEGSVDIFRESNFDLIHSFVVCFMYI